jgi:phosphoglycolate phosphatase
MAIRLVVFDLDGTLIDSRRDLADSVNAVLVELGAAPRALDDVTAMVGEGAAVLVQRALSVSGLPPDMPGALDRFLEHYARRLTNHTRPYPGIAETLDGLTKEGLTLAVLTNKPQNATNEILERLGLARRFAEVIGGDTAAGRKPDPAGLLSIARDAGTLPAETLLVGDSAIDLRTAHRAGSAICLARYGFGLHLDDVPLRGDERFIDQPADLLPLVRSFRANTPAAPAPETSQSRT